MEEITKWIFVGLWIFVILITLTVEFVTVGILSGIAAVAAIPSLLVAIFWGEKAWAIPVEIVTAIGLWTLGYFTIYKLLKTKIFNRFSNFKSSVEDYIGKKFELVASSDEESNSLKPYGKIKIQDKYFRTLSAKNQGKIEKGVLVKVVKIEGNTLFIEKVGE